MPRVPALLAVIAFAFLLCRPALAGDTDVLAVIHDAKGEAVPDAVIALYALDNQPAPVADSSGAPVEIVQRDQEYSPYVTVIRVGTQVVFPNQDSIQHHIYSLSKPKRFEKPLYAPGAHESVLFDQPGIVTLGCNIHDWMVAYVVVLPTPYFAKTDSTGAAHLDVPAGRYRIEVWHPRLGGGPETREAKIGPGAAPLDYVLKLKPDRRIRRTPEGKVSGY
jgi:plastocyanin